MMDEKGMVTSILNMIVEAEAQQMKLEFWDE